jgi:hypothetical protein
MLDNANKKNFSAIHTENENLKRKNNDKIVFYFFLKT